MSAAHEVDDASGGADDDLSAGLNIIHLASDGATADSESEADIESGGESAGFEADLFAEFASGSEDEHLHAVEFAVDLFERGQHEGSGLAGAGASLSDAVIAGEGNGNESSLDGTGGVVPDLAKSTECRRGQSEFLEGCGR